MTADGSRTLEARFEVAASRTDVLAILADPRQLVTANHSKPILDSSPGPVGRGSWAVIGLDQLRARVDYEAFDRDVVDARVVVTGRGAHDAHQMLRFELADGSNGGTAVRLTTAGSGGFLPLAGLLWPLAWRSIRRRLEAALGTGP